MPKQVRVSPKFKWMIPYVELGLTFVSPKHRLDRVGSWTINKSRGRNEHAALIQTKKGDPFRIWIHTHFYYGEKGQIRPFSKIDLLNSLAHEIAHMEDWNHTPKHNLIEAKIKAAFSVMLGQEGYESEEEEMR